MYLLSFPARAMVVDKAELPAVSEASHAVVRAAKAAGVWVFGGGIDDRIAPVLVDGTGEVRPGGYPETAELDGGFAILELPSEAAAHAWAAKLAVACRCPQQVRVFGDDPEH